jgi:hypothetical protein
MFTFRTAYTFINGLLTNRTYFHMKNYNMKFGLTKCLKSFKINYAGVAELVDARDLKSLVPKERIGSSPISGTSKINAFL